MNGSSIKHIQLYVEKEEGYEWVNYDVGDDVPLKDGIYIGSKGSSVVYDGWLVAAWDKPNQLIPHGTPRQRETMSNQMHLEDAVAHISIESLKEASEAENLDWETEALPNIETLIGLVGMEIDPIRICMVACAKMKRMIKEGL